MKFALSEQNLLFVIASIIASQYDFPSTLCRPNIWSAEFYFIYSYVNVYLTCI